MNYLLPYDTVYAVVVGDLERCTVNPSLSFQCRLMDAFCNRIGAQGILKNNDCDNLLLIFKVGQEILAAVIRNEDYYNYRSQLRCFSLVRCT